MTDHDTILIEPNRLFREGIKHLLAGSPFCLSAEYASIEQAVGHSDGQDRVVQMATKLVVEPPFEAEFLPLPYRFRPKRRATEALDGLQRSPKKPCRWEPRERAANIRTSLSLESLPETR